MEDEMLLLSTAYFAPIEYYAALCAYPIIKIEQHEFFVKQTYRNRCEILGANGKQTLSIPLQSRKNKSLTKDIRIDYKTPWQTQHWRSIESAYNASPFFEYFQDDLRPNFLKKPEFLFDFNLHLQEQILEIMEFKISTSFSESYLNDIPYGIDARNQFLPNQISTKNFPPYIQVFENKFEFVPNLSILDLVFNLGNESVSYLKLIQ